MNQVEEELGGAGPFIRAAGKLVEHLGGKVFYDAPQLDVDTARDSLFAQADRAELLADPERRTKALEQQGAERDDLQLFTDRAFPVIEEDAGPAPVSDGRVRPSGALLGTEESD